MTKNDKDILKTLEKIGKLLGSSLKVIPDFSKNEKKYNIRACLVSDDVKVFMGTFVNVFDARCWALKIVNAPENKSIPFSLILSDDSGVLEQHTYWE